MNEQDRSVVRSGLMNLRSTANDSIRRALEPIENGLGERSPVPATRNSKQRYCSDDRGKDHYSGLGDDASREDTCDDRGSLLMNGLFHAG